MSTQTGQDHLDLPEKSYTDVRIELPEWQRRLYDQMRDEEIRGLSGEQYRAYAATALSKLTQLIQIASNPALIFPELDRLPAKFGTLDGLIGDILSVPGRKVIVWSNYIGTIEGLLERLPDAVAIYGATPTGERQEIARRFQEDPDTRVLIANPAAAGTGFTLTAASFTVYESLSWRYDHYAQSQDRNHRTGQTEPVTYLRLLAADTIEEAVVAALERKSALARSLLGDRDRAGDVASLAEVTHRIEHRRKGPLQVTRRHMREGICVTHVGQTDFTVAHIGAWTLQQVDLVGLGRVGVL